MSTPEITNPAQSVERTVETIRPPRTDTYRIEHFTESSDSAMAHLAWEIHAQGYQEMGFVHTEAVTESGYLPTSIDKARGENVDYYVAMGERAQVGEILEDMASLRKISIPENGDLEDLPAYQMSKDVLYEDAKNELHAIGNSHIKEISALARTHDAGPIAVFELVRDIIHEARGKDEVFFYCIVSKTFDTFQATFGDKLVQQVGSPIELHDERVGDHIKLIPTLSRIDQSFQRIAAAIDESNNPLDKKRLTRTLFFLADGLSDNELDEEFIPICGERVRQELRGAR